MVLGVVGGGAWGSLPVGFAGGCEPVGRLGGGWGWLGVLGVVAGF